MSSIKYGNGNYVRVGYNNSTYRKVAFGTGQIRTLLSYTYYNISSSQYGTRDSKYLVRVDEYKSQANSSVDDWTYSYSNSATSEKRASYLGSAAFTSTNSLASASDANSTTSYNNSYVKTYNYSAYYSGSATTSVKNVTYTTQTITSSKSTYYTTTYAGNASMTYNIPVKNNITRSSWKISRSSSKSSKYEYYNITRSSYANRDSKYLVNNGTMTSVTSKENNNTYSYINQSTTS